MDKKSGRSVKMLVLLIFCVSGASALMYEVAWTRALSLILGSTVYALSTLLGTFMAGLATGAYLGGKVADSKRDLLAWFGYFELGIGLFGILAVPLIYRLPPVYFSVYKTFHLIPPVYFLFQFLLCAFVMILPTTLMGATFPVVSKLVTENMEEMGTMVGTAYFVNTFGAIIGSLAAGFLLIPVFGISATSFVAAGMNVLSGIALLVFSGHAHRDRRGLVQLLLFFGVAILLAAALRTGPVLGSFYIASRVNDYSAIREFEKKNELLYEKDHAQGTVRAFSEKGFLTIQNGGKLEGTTSVDLANTMMLATLPVASYGKKVEDMLVIGLGAGVTTWFSRQLAGHVDVVEINPGVAEIVSRFGLPDALEGVSLHIDDARNYLSLTEKRYDVITSEPSVPSESTSANLFTREFYEIAASRLKDGGIFCQWMPSWAMTKRDTHIALKTFGTVFDHTYLWVVRASHDFLMVGSKSPIGHSAEEIVRRATGLNVRLPFDGKFPDGAVDGKDLYASLMLVRDPLRVREIVADTKLPLITDDRPYLEFAVTKNLLYGPDYQTYRP